MLHAILRNTPLFLLVVSALFSGILSIAVAHTTDRKPVATSMPANVSAETKTNYPVRHKTEFSLERKAFQARAAAMRANAAKSLETTIAPTEKQRANISEDAKNRVRAAIRSIQSRINHAILKLGSIADRIETRAHTLEERGVAVEPALELVARARIELRAASVIVTADLAAEVDAAIAAEDPRAAFVYVKQSVREANEHIHAAQKALRDAVAALKEAERHSNLE